VKFCQFVDSLYPHMPTNFGRFILIFNKLALLFLGVLIIFYHFKFQISAIQIASTSSLMMSGPNLPNFNPLNYQVWGQCWSLNTSGNRSQKQFWSFTIHFTDFS